MEKTKKLDYINGLKGVACLGVMLGHFSDMVFSAEDASAILTLPQNPLTHLLMLLFAESLYLGIFFVVSGYLISLSAITTTGQLVKKSFKRVLRFLLPIFFAGIIIYIIAALLGFYNAQTADIIDNWWLQSQYDSTITIKDIFTDPIKVVFLGKIKLNHPYWVISRMLASSIIIYILNFLRTATKNKILKTAIYVGSVLLFFAFWWKREFVYMGCLLGMFINWAMPVLEKARFIKYICAATCLILSVFCYFKPGIFVFVFWSASVLLCFLSFKKLQSVFSKKPFLFLGYVSFGVYSFHWPLWNSLGCLLLIKLYGKINGGLLFVLIMAITAAVTIGVAYCYAKTGEKWSAAITDKIMLLLPHKKTKKQSEAN